MVIFSRNVEIAIDLSFGRGSFWGGAAILASALGFTTANPCCPDLESHPVARPWCSALVLLSVKTVRLITNFVSYCTSYAQ